MASPRSRLSSVRAKCRASAGVVSSRLVSSRLVSSRLVARSRFGSVGRASRQRRPRSLLRRHRVSRSCEPWGQARVAITRNRVERADARLSITGHSEPVLSRVPRGFGSSSPLLPRKNHLRGAPQGGVSAVSRVGRRALRSNGVAASDAHARLSITGHQRRPVFSSVATWIPLFPAQPCPRLTATEDARPWDSRARSGSVRGRRRES